jgi:hypothetical protein
MKFFIGMQFAASMNAASMNEPLREPRILTAATHGLIHPGLFYSVFTEALRRTRTRRRDRGGLRVRSICMYIIVYIYVITSARPRRDRRDAVYLAAPANEAATRRREL